MSNIIDLDVVIPQSAIIKFDGKEIEVKPPTVAETIRLGLWAEIMTDQRSGLAEIERAVTEVTAFMHRHIPGLNNKPLNKFQLNTLMQVIADLNTPQEKKELAARGITTDTEKKASQD
jgi:hypothetical protein